jgi:hypothetical protein
MPNSNPSTKRCDLILQNNKSYHDELQRQKLYRLARELDAITDPVEKQMFIQQRVLENLEHVKRLLATLQPD